jgi:hypothetical protein
MANKMETTQSGQMPQEISADALQAELDKIEKRWITVPKGEAIVVTLTGKIYKRKQTFKDKKTGAQLDPVDMIDFELIDKMSTGENKILSRNMKNSDVQKILDFIKMGKLELMLSADNNGKINVAAVKR